MIDELGYMELDRRGAELHFQVLTELEEKDSIAIASNLRIAQRDMCCWLPAEASPPAAADPRPSPG